jgi:hypothetical protein
MVVSRLVEHRSNYFIAITSTCHMDRLLRRDIVHFHFECLGTEVFLRVTRSFLTNCYFIFTNFLTIFFIVQRHGSMTTNDYVTQSIVTQKIVM